LKVVLLSTKYNYYNYHVLICSQPSVILEPTLDMDNLKDPEQFFLAFERLEGHLHIDCCCCSCCCC